MLKTIDEILKKYASYWDDFPVPAPEPPKPEEIVKVKPSIPETTGHTVLPKPIPLPKQPERPLSKRDMFEKGSPEWVAENETHKFLTETQQDYQGAKGWINHPGLQGLVAKTMDKLVAEHPEQYFQWKLNMKLKLQPWLYDAAKSLIEKDPTTALYERIYRFPELAGTKRDMSFDGMKMPATLNAKLFWDVRNLMVKELAAKDKLINEKVFDEMMLRKMRQLTGVLAKTDPEFYHMFIEHLPITTKKFVGQMERVRNPSDDIKLKNKTKL